MLSLRGLLLDQVHRNTKRVWVREGQNIVRAGQIHPSEGQRLFSYDMKEDGINS